MPNSLAHFGFQGLVCHAVLRAPDPRWILLGAILPDIPWIAYRLIGTFAPPFDPYDLRVAFIIWASLFACLLLAAIVALLARERGRVFAILALGALLHLLLDAAQTKWGSGVHLAAPISWRTLNFGLFWPESPLTVLLTISGVGYAVWTWRRRSDLPGLRNTLTPPPRAALTILLTVYLLLPAIFAPAAENADPHYVQTLRQSDQRGSLYIEFDRRPARSDSAGAALRTFTGEQISLVGGAARGIVSVRGRFSHPDTIMLLAVHTHAGRSRDVASVAGLLFFLSLLMATSRSPAIRAAVPLSSHRTDSARMCGVAPERSGDPGHRAVAGPQQS